ncbi:MAG TPA: hypothetical protein VF226_06770 [Hyphomicrobiaceae bacterium]
MNERSPVQMSKPQQTRPAENVSGWIEAGLYVFAVAVLSVMNAFAVAHGAHPIVFILYSLLIAAAGMLAITGLGDEPVRIMLSPMSWLVGIGAILVEVGFCLALTSLSPAEGSLSLRLSIPMAIVLGWMTFRRSPGVGVWLGAAIILLGVGTLVVIVDLGTQAVGLLYGTIAAAAICLRSFAAEFHPWNRAARSVFEKMRVTGLVVLVTGIAGLLLVGLAAALVGGGLIDRSDLAPAPSDLSHWPTMVMALFLGGIVFTSMNYLQFSSVVKIQTENFIATSAFMPLATLLLQSVAVALGIIEAAVFDWRLLPGILLAMAGVTVLIAYGRKR